MQLNIPPQQNIDLAGYGEQMARDTSKWIINLTETEIAEVETAAKLKDGGGKPLQSLLFE